MVLKVMKFFRGYLFVRLTGYSPERFFNLCGNADIVLWKIEPAEDGYTFFVSLPAFRKLKPMLRKANQSYDFETCRCSVFTVSIPSSSLFLCWVRQSVCNSVFDDTVYLGGRNIRKQQLFRTGITRFSDRIRYRLRKLENAVLTVRRQRHCYAGNLMISPGCLPGYPVHGCMWISRSD